MTIAREEIFGHVLALLTFDDFEQGVQLANHTIYGLAAGIWTRDIQKAHRAAKAIRAGTVWINSYNFYDSGAPFGGFKASGFGRDLGREALDGYLETKRGGWDCERHVHLGRAANARWKARRVARRRAA